MLRSLRLVEGDQGGSADGTHSSCDAIIAYSEVYKKKDIDREKND